MIATLLYLIKKQLPVKKTTEPNKKVTDEVTINVPYYKVYVKVTGSSKIDKLQKIAEAMKLTHEEHLKLVMDSVLGLEDGLVTKSGLSLIEAKSIKSCLIGSVGIKVDISAVIKPY